MGFPKRDRKLLKELNSTQIPAALFQGAVHVLEGLGTNAFHLENRITAFQEFFSKKGYTFQEASRLVQAVEFRMGALLRLKDEHGLLDWSVPDKGASDDASDPYLAAAATEPLVEHGRDGISFDPERFRARLKGAQPG